jgi:hypothetical protein
LIQKVSGATTHKARNFHLGPSTGSGGSSPERTEESQYQAQGLIAHFCCTAPPETRMVLPLLYKTVDIMFDVPVWLAHTHV